MTSAEQTQALLTRMRELSAGDLSILEAVVESLEGEDEVRLTTTPGSANDRLWSEMTVLGWMSADAPLEVPVDTKVFVVHAAARERLSSLLLDLKRDALPALFSDLRREIPAKIVPPVVAAGGTPADVSLMLAGIVERTMRKYIKPDLHEAFVDDIVRKVRLLKDEP